MNCPSCKTVVLSMSERSGIEIDFCPECRGVWLDRGELDKIIEKSQTETVSSSQSKSLPLNDPYSHKDYYRHKRKKSFLEEIFD